MRKTKLREVFVLSAPARRKLAAVLAALALIWLINDYRARGARVAQLEGQIRELARDQTVMIAGAVSDARHGLDQVDQPEAPASAEQMHYAADRLEEALVRISTLGREPFRPLFPADPTQHLSMLDGLVNTTRLGLRDMVRTGDYTRFVTYRDRVRLIDDAFPNGAGPAEFWQGLMQLSFGP